jgi:Holliday junction DNA helicase RuvA
VAGIGYKVFLSRQTLLRLPEIGENLKVFTYQNVKEEALDLYGFLSYETLEFFETLMDIRGVGPKSALDISDLGSLDKIKDRILRQDEKIFEGIPGIGSKKAMTIILELTGKIKVFGQKKGSADEAESALMQLGFSKQQAKDALARVPSSVKVSEERIKAALKNLGK